MDNIQEMRRILLSQVPKGSIVDCEEVFIDGVSVRDYSLDNKPLFREVNFVINAIFYLP